MEDKTKKLVLTLELLALVTAGLLILIDYKLKRDLLALFIRIEKAIAYGETLYPPHSANTGDTGSVRHGDMASHNARMETRPADKTDSPNGKPQPATGNRASANRSRGTRNTPVPDSGEQVGP